MIVSAETRSADDDEGRKARSVGAQRDLALKSKQAGNGFDAHR